MPINNTIISKGQIDNIMEHILNQNNIGVAHICQGRYAEARKAFKAALAGLTALHGKENSDRNQCSSSSFPIHIEHQPIPAATTKSDKLYMYRNVMLIYKQGGTSSEGDEENMTKANADENCLATLITFNFTLTLQYKVDKGFEYGSKSWSEEQEKVLRLYKQVLKLLQIDTNKSSSYRDIISLAVVNNMGGIFYQLTMYKKAWGCFESLDHTLDHTLESHNNTYQVASPDVLDRIMVNVFLTKDQFEKSTKVVRRSCQNFETINGSLPNPCSTMNGN